MSENEERESPAEGSEPEVATPESSSEDLFPSMSTRERLRSVSPRNRNLMLALLGVGLLAFAWYVRSVLNPLIAAYFLAFVLHPLVLRLQTYGWSRARAVNTIFATAILLLGAVGIGIGGQALHYSRMVNDEVWVEHQIGKIDGFLIKNKDEVARLAEFLGYPIHQVPEQPEGKPTPPGEEGGKGPAASGEEDGQAEPEPQLVVRDEDVMIGALLEELWESVSDSATVSEGIQEVKAPATQERLNFVSSLFGSAMALLAFLVLLPIYTYFLLFELEAIHSFVRRYIPRSQRERVSDVGGQIGEVIGSFFRGRLTICLAKGLFIAAGLGVCGVDYALLLGMAAGALSLIPFAGPVLSFLAALVVALQQPASASKESFDFIAALWRTGLVFGLAEVFEGYYLTPKILGESLGLHPVVVLVSIFAGGAAFGLFGILLALPVTAALVILFRVFVMPAMERLADE